MNTLWMQQLTQRCLLRLLNFFSSSYFQKGIEVISSVPFFNSTTMINYKSVTLADIKQSKQLRQMLKEDFKELKNLDIDANCDIDVTFAYSLICYKIMKTRKYEMLVDSLTDYEKGKAFVKDSFLDEDVDDLLKRTPEYSQYFKVHDTAEKAEEETAKPKRKGK